MKYLKTLTLKIVLLLGISVPSNAQTWENFVPGLQINDIAIDSIGDIWCATETGLAHFHDDKLVSVITNPLNNQVSRMNKIKIDRLGRIWIAQESKLFYFKNNSWGTITSPHNITLINAIEFDNVGRIYIGTSRALFRGIDTVIGSQLSNNQVNFIKSDPSGGVWVAYKDRGVAYINDNINTTLNTIDGLISSNITSIEIDNSNNKWFGSSIGISKYSSSSTFTNLNMNNSPFPNNNILSINSHSGTTYVLFSTKLMTYASGVWKTDTSFKYNHPVRDLMIANTGEVYVSKSIGLEVYRSNTWISLNYGLMNKGCYSIGVDNNNVVFVAQVSSVALLKNQKIATNWEKREAVVGIKSLTNYNGPCSGSLKKEFFWVSGYGRFSAMNYDAGIVDMKDGVCNVPFSQIASDNITDTKEEKTTGVNWFSTYDNGLVSWNGGLSITNYKVGFSGLVSNQVYAIEIDNQNNKWVGTSRGLQKFDGNNWTTYTKSTHGILSDTILSLAFDKDSNLWISTPIGFSKFNGTNCINYTSANTGVPMNTPTKIRFDLLGGLWAGVGCYTFWTVGGILSCQQGTGLIHFDGEKWSHYNTSNSGIIANSVFDVAIDKNNNKWIATYEGLSLFRYQSINTKVDENSKIDYDINVFPNPTNDKITIDNGDLSKMNGYSVKIMNSLGQQIFQSTINQQQFNIDITTWGGIGVYFLQLIDNGGNIVDIRKILLQ